MKAIFPSALAIALLATSSTSLAADRRVEFNAAFSLDNNVINSQADDESSADYWNVGGKIFVTAASDEEGPLAEAAFISRSTTIQFASYTDIELDESSVELQLDRYSVRAVLSSFILELAAEEGRLDPGEDIGDRQRGNYSASFGAYVGANTTLMARYSKNKAFYIDPAAVLAEHDIYEVAVRWLTIGDETNASFALGASLGTIDLEDEDDGLDLGLELAIYPSKRVGINISGKTANLEHFDRRMLNLSAEWFVTDQIALSAGYRDIVIELDEDQFDGIVANDLLLENDIEQYDIGIRVRF